MLIQTAKGLFCSAGNFYIDPSRAVEHAVITHAHSDHARKGSQQYYCVTSGVGLLRNRIGKNIQVKSYDFGKTFRLGAVDISFHPAGHILGSSQVRLQYEDEIWVASGDYKREADPTCEPFEVVPCDVFVTEATFGTPSFRWNKSADLGSEIYDWWLANSRRGVNSIVFAYSLGKTQRLLGLLKPFMSKPIYCHPAAAGLIECYRNHGVELAATICLSSLSAKEKLSGEMFISPTSLINSEYSVHLEGPCETAFASGWMAQRSRPNRQDGYDRGFLLSDHADWDDLVRTIIETKAKRVYVQHRGEGALVRHLKTLGIQAHSIKKLEPPDQGNQLQLF